jgi:UDP-glucose 4-epimerase
MKLRKILIIGSKGFIGQHLFNYLQQKGYDVCGADVVVDYVNTKHYFLIDASNSDFNPVFQYFKYDLCINCSGAASVPDSIDNPMRDYYLNTVNVFKLLVAIVKYQPECRFVNLSSAAVYGNPKKLPIKEIAKPDPVSPYGVHKLYAEKICKEFYDFYKIRTCSLRIFSVYGAGLQKQLFWDLYKRAKTGVNFTLYGSGNESRDFIYILDLIKAIELAAEFSDFKADVINIANGKEIIIRDAVNIFFSFFGFSIKYTFSGDVRKGDPVNWLADISKLVSFGYKPSIDIDNGLKKFYEWIKNNEFLEL